MLWHPDLNPGNAFVSEDAAATTDKRRRLAGCVGSSGACVGGHAAWGMLRAGAQVDVSLPRRPVPSGARDGARKARSGAASMRGAVHSAGALLVGRLALAAARVFFETAEDGKRRGCEGKTSWGGGVPMRTMGPYMRWDVLASRK